MVELINGEFAISIIDVDKKNKNVKVYLLRDQCGIRPMFYGENKDCVAWCSEVKGLTAYLGTDNAKQIVSNIKQLPPRHVVSYNITVGIDGSF